LGTVSNELQLPTTPRLRTILARAADIARECGVGVIGAEHVFLATLEDERSVPTQVLSLDADVAGVRGRLVALLESPGYRGTG
jgi:Clp amino terminal domain, pathogenicity island component